MSPTAETAAGAASHAYPEVRFRELFEQAPVSLQILDPEGYTVQVNRAWEALWHIHEGSELKRYVMSRDYNVLRDPQLVTTGVAACLARAMSGESVEIPAIHYDTAAIGQSGRARWVTARAHPIKDEQGRVVEVMLMHEDITERVQAESILREREERFRTLAMATSQIVWANTAGGEVREDSPSWRAFTGQSYEQYQGNGWADAVHPDDRERARQRWNESVTTRSVFETEYRLRRADGSYRWTAVKGIPILAPDGSVREWVGANRDIHDSVTQQEGLLQRLDSERRQSALLAQVANAARTLHTALSSENIEEALVEEVRAILGAAQVEVMLDGDTSATAAGEPVHDSLALPLLDRKGRQIGRIRAAGKAGGFDDRDEAILAQLAAIAATGFANARLYRSLREQDRRKDEFLAMLAHELRNPLAPIAAAAEILRIAADPARIRASSEVIARQVRHMTSLVNDLLDVSRVTRGLIKLDKTLVGIGTVVASAVEQARPLVEARGHALTLEVTPDLAAARVHGDATRLVQVIANLLNNAAKYTPGRGAIRLSAAREGERVRLCVEDNGIGIDAGLLPQVFDLFTQAERTPDRSQGGLGIGLALVRTMVALHGGEVQAHSDGPGKGCVFSVWLPLA